VGHVFLNQVLSGVMGTPVPIMLTAAVGEAGRPPREVGDGTLPSQHQVNQFANSQSVYRINLSNSHNAKHCQFYIQLGICLPR
jgi:hypothetical protein